MIKINLVPVKEKKKRKEIFIVFCVAAVLVFVALGMAWIYGKRLAVRNGLKTQISQVEEESKGYQDKINEVKELQNKEDSLDAFKKTIKSISEIQRKVMVAMDQIALSLPDGVWLTQVSQGKGPDANKFTISGYSFTQESLQDYYENLKKPGGPLKDAVLTIKNISASVGSNKQINQFEIDLKVADQGS